MIMYELEQSYLQLKHLTEEDFYIHQEEMRKSENRKTRRTLLSNKRRRLGAREGPVRAAAHQ